MEIFQFLQWIGISEFPRYRKITISKDNNPEFLNYVISSLKYPAQFNDTTCKTPSDVKAARIDDVQTLDGLQEILANANPDSILAWLAVDIRATEWLRPSDTQGKISILPKGCKSRRYYTGSIPSYIHWKIAHTQWLPTEQGSLLEPANCVVGERAIELLFPRPYFPDEKIFNKYPWNHDNLRDAWQKSGVIQGLGILDREELYRLLLQLPEKSPDGKSVQALYLWVINRETTIRGEYGPYYQEFIKNGKMWGHCGNDFGYFPVTELLHADTEDLPIALLNKLKIVSIQKRTGVDKVRRLFGVKPVEREKITQKIFFHKPVEGADAIAREFNEIKPYLLALRSSLTAPKYQLARLESLNLIVCSEILAHLEYENEKFEQVMKPYDWIVIDNSDLYLKVDPFDDVFLNSPLLADAIGTAIAPIFELANGGDFARIISCGENQRIPLLQKMLGKGSELDLESLKKDMSKFVRTQTRQSGFAYQKPEIIDESDKKETTTEEKPEITKEIGDNQKTNESEDLPETLEIRKKDHIPAQPSKDIPLRIQKKSRGSSGGGFVSHTHPIANGDFCERKTEEFEIMDSPPRWPLLVSHITGFEAPGCDVISFSSEEDKKQFLEDPKNRGELIARYIEVKGRSDKNARIDLKGNELNAAMNYKDKYFLYRYYEEKPGHFILSILQNPLNEKEALSKIFEINLEKAISTEAYELVGGLLNEVKKENS